VPVKNILNSFHCSLLWQEIGSQVDCFRPFYSQKVIRFVWVCARSRCLMLIQENALITREQPRRCIKKQTVIFWKTDKRESGLRLLNSAGHMNHRPYLVLILWPRTYLWMIDMYYLLVLGVRHAHILLQRDTLSEATVTLRTVVTFVTWLISRSEFLV